MWRSLWRSIDRFSLQYFKYILNELRDIKVVDKFNKEVVIDLLQSIVEIVTYGDRHDPQIFEYFMEYQVIAEFVRILKISRNSRIEGPLLQYLSIMIQNMNSEHAIYYCFSNEYINSIITHQFDFDGGDLAPYYVSFLRAVSGKLNRDTLCLLVKVQEDAVVSFPLYSEALKFADHGEKMIQIAVRALTLNIYNVCDDMVYRFLTTPSISEYFSRLVLRLRWKCFHLDELVHDTGKTWTHERRKELILETDKIVDDLYYFNDILCVGESCVSRLVTQNLLSLLVFPTLLPLLQLSHNSEINLSPVTTLFLISRLLQVISVPTIVNTVASAILYSYMEGVMFSTLESGPEKSYQTHMFAHLSEYMSSNPPCDGIQRERTGIFPLILSDNQSILLAALFLLLVLAESKDMDYLLRSRIGFSRTEAAMKQDFNSSSSQLVDGSIVLHMPQILNALLKILAGQPPVPVLMQWHTGWVLRKLLFLQEKKLTDHDLHLFSASFDQSHQCLWKELDGCWFDYIPDTLKKEWTTCKTALEESSQSKDPFFALDLTVQEQTSNGHLDPSIAWQKMVDAVKACVLHLQLRDLIFDGKFRENPLTNLKSSDATPYGQRRASDFSSANFGVELDTGSGVPCKISFSKVGMRDIYMLPVASGRSGKLLLMEKHPHRARRGVVFAVAPLAALSPKIDGDHPTWLHLRIREFDARADPSKSRGYRSSTPNTVAEGKWTLGFLNPEACEAARLLILDEISKQRSFVESLISPLIHNHSPENLSNN